jgi:hypothetical protein
MAKYDKKSKEEVGKAMHEHKHEISIKAASKPWPWA